MAFRIPCAFPGKPGRKLRPGSALVHRSLSPHAPLHSLFRNEVKAETDIVRSACRGIEQRGQDETLEAEERLESTPLPSSSSAASAEHPPLDPSSDELLASAPTAGTFPFPTRLRDVVRGWTARDNLAQRFLSFHLANYRPQHTTY